MNAEPALPCCRLYAEAKEDRIGQDLHKHELTSIQSPVHIRYAYLVRLRHKPNGDPADAVISGKNSQSFNLSNAASLLGFCDL
jgi:hypothetical protein